MEKSVVLRDGSVLQIFRPRGEIAAEMGVGRVDDAGADDGGNAALQKWQGGD